MPGESGAGRAVAWQEIGTGAPALMLHCALAHSGAFSGVARRLGGILRTRAVDLPGHGGTDHDPERGLIGQAVEDALCALGDWPRAHVIGHSLGGVVALRLAVAFPERVASLCLIEPVLFALLAETDPEAYAREIATSAPVAQAARRGDWRAATEMFLDRWSAGGGLAAMPEAQARYMIERMPLVIGSEVDSPRSAEPLVRRADLARIICPTLLIEGAESPPVIGAIQSALLEGIPDARRVVLPGAGHMSPLTHPGALAEVLRGFFAQRVQEGRDIGAGG